VSRKPLFVRSPLLAIAALIVAATSGGVVVHVAGLPPPAVGTVGEDGPAADAALNNAEDVAVAPNGDVYIADYNSARLLRIRDGILTVAYRGDFTADENDFAGVAVAADGTVFFTTGEAVMSISSEGTIAEVLAEEQGSQVYGPKLAVGPDGALYVAGGRRPRLDRIEADGSTTLIAGSDEPATEAGLGDGGPATDARFLSISDLAIDSSGAIFIADEGFGDIRRIGPDGVISTVFGDGTVPFTEAVDGDIAADIDYGSAEIGVAVDSSDRLYVIPRLVGKVWVIDQGVITTVLGGGTNPGTGFPPLETQLSAPFRIALTNDGDVLVLVEDGRYLYQSSGAVGVGSLIDSVPSPTQINLDPVVVAASVALAAGMLFLVPFPAEIFNNTMVEHHDQIRAWFRRRKGDETPAIWHKPWVLLLGLIAMALLYGFLDPDFGVNGASVPTFLGLLIGVLVTTVGFALPTMIMRRRRTEERGILRVLPVALLVGVGCVVLSRLIGFLPGYLYGVALGLVFAAEVGEDAEAREVTISAVVILALALGAWFGLGAVRSSESGTFSDVVQAALAMTTVSAFEALVFGLLPIHGMPGRVLFKQRRWLWAVVWGVSVLAFFHVLVNPQSGYLVDTAIVPVATTYGLLAFFTLISLGLWAWFRRQERT
jgi:hypothetical protein